jgi:hypothetical protein
VKITSFALSLFLIAACTSMAGAGQPEYSVKTLYADCVKKNSRFCDGYLSGVAKALDVQRKFIPKWAENYCPPDLSEAAHLREVFVSWADRSSVWTATAYDGVVMALAIESFCPL